MRALFYVPALCLAGVTAFPQALPRVSPQASSVCSIPLLRFVPPDIDPLISRKLLQASDRTPVVRAPAPPCPDSAARSSSSAELQGDSMERAMAALKRYLSGRKPPAENPEATPTPAP